MNKSIMIGIPVAILIAASVWLIIGKYDDDQPTEESSAVVQQDQDSSVVNAVPVPGSEIDEAVVVGEDESISAIVTYIDGKFDPAMIGPISPGSTVKFVNKSTKPVWIASDNHPTHKNLPEFDTNTTIAAGGEYMFTFDEAGQWGYHNHLNASETGTIQVDQL